jgi:hypothetical protein
MYPLPQICTEWSPSVNGNTPRRHVTAITVWDLRDLSDVEFYLLRYNTVPSMKVNKRVASKAATSVFVSCLAYASTPKMQVMFIRNAVRLPADNAALYPGIQNTSLIMLLI